MQAQACAHRQDFCLRRMGCEQQQQNTRLPTLLYLILTPSLASVDQFSSSFLLSTVIFSPSSHHFLLVANTFHFRLSKFECCGRPLGKRELESVRWASAMAARLPFNQCPAAQLQLAQPSKVSK